MVDCSKNRELGELISCVKSGDNEAFELLLEKYTPLIESLVVKCLDEEYS